MPISVAAQRRLELQQLEDQLGQLNKELEDAEWIERLLENTDFKKLCNLYQKERDDHEESLNEMKNVLENDPMPHSKADVVRQKVMLMNRDKINTAGFISFPARELVRLKEARVEIVKIEERIKELKKIDGGENHGT